MRSSVSRRSSVKSVGQKSPAPRPRSQERSLKQPAGGIVLSFEDDVLDKLGGSFDESNGSRDEENGRDDDGDGGIDGAIPIPHLTHQNGHLHHDHHHKGNRARLASDSSLSKVVRSHRRAMSDPFDTADCGGITDGLMDDLQSSSGDFGLIEEEENALPTLQRFPCAVNHDANCWSEPPAEIFHIRGKNYFVDSKKIIAKRFLMQARGCDLFLSPHPDAVKMSSIKGALEGNLRKKPSLLIRLTFPWGLLIQYYEIPESYAKYMRPGKLPPVDETFTPGEKSLVRWLSGDREYKNERLKLISYVAEGPWIVRNLVTGKPAIIGKKLPVKYSYTPKEGSKQDFLECNLDIGNSSATARKIVSVCRRYMSALSVDIGFVIEGKDKDELPEEMLGAIRVHEVDPLKAPTVH